MLADTMDTFLGAMNENVMCTKTCSYMVTLATAYMIRQLAGTAHRGQEEAGFLEVVAYLKEHIHEAGRQIEMWENEVEAAGETKQ